MIAKKLFDFAKIHRTVGRIELEFLTQLWLPILVSAVAIFIVSFITHMVLPFHKSEFKRLPNEDHLMAELSKVPAENYMFPCPENSKDMNSPEYRAKMDQGPNGLLIVWPSKVNMGQNLGLTFLFYILVGIFVAYLGTHSIDPGATYMHRFRICGTIAFASHGLGWMSFLIWFKYNRFWPNFLDAVLYSLVTAGIFASMWPGA